MTDTVLARRQMVDQQVRAWDVLDEAVLEVMQRVPREAFVPPAYRELAYADTAIPLAHEQHMLRPMIDGRILQALGLQPTDSVLEIGTGSGFLAACMGGLAENVHSVEIYPDLASGAANSLRRAGCNNVRVETNDGFSLAAESCYDAIALTGSLPVYDARFEKALKPGGRLFAVVGQGPAMTANLITRTESGDVLRQNLFETQIDALIHAAEPSRFIF